MNRILLLSFVFMCVTASAQEKTYGVDDDRMRHRDATMGSLVIIPFEDGMYMSDADAPIGRETGLNPGEIMSKFRNSLVQDLEDELRKDWNISVFHEEMKLNQGFGLDYVHSSVQYNYTAIPDEVQMHDDTTLTKKELKKRKQNSGRESGIKEGQVVTHSNEVEKYMSLVIKNDTLIGVMDSTLHSDYYLFINEFDIRHHIDDPSKIANGGLKYKLKVHFSCVDAKGNTLISGAVTSKVNSGNKNVYEIISQGIPEVTEKIAKIIRKKELEKMDQ